MIATTGTLAHASPASHLAVAVGILGLVAVHAAASLRLRRPVRERLAAAGAATVALVATAPPLEAAARESFTGHMVQHLLLVVVAAPLVALARPVATASAHPGVRAALSPVRRRAAAAAGLGALAAAGAFVATLLLTHLTGLYDLALRSRWVHDLEHLAYVGTAAALWSAVLGAGRASATARIAAAGGTLAGTAMVAAVLVSADRPLVDTYVDRSGLVAALADQDRAAALMWVAGMFTTLPLIVVAVWRWASLEHRVTVAREALEDRAR